MLSTVLRIGTRVPIFLPQRITPDLCAILAKHHPLWMSVHVNHARELTIEVKEALERLALEGLRADAAYFDLGMSSLQLDARERGFSYSYDAPLDMRMDPSAPMSAAEVVAQWDERRLARALRDFGEEPRAGAIARAIVRRRARSPITTTRELVDTISAAIARV